MIEDACCLSGLDNSVLLAFHLSLFTLHQDCAIIQAGLEFEILLPQDSQVLGLHLSSGSKLCV